MQHQAGSRLPWTEEFMTQGPIGEDCLFLNVWTAARAPNGRVPVMFWIYGGGFNEGSSSVAVYDGTNLAKKGVIVVDAERYGEDDLMVAIDAGAEDISREDDSWEIVTEPSDLTAVRKALDDAGVEIQNAEVTQRPI